MSELVACFACGHKIHSSADKCPSCGATRGFSWLAFFFGPLYYAGKGSYKKAALLTFLSAIPYVGFLICIYCGFKANKQIDRSRAFNWLAVIPPMVFLVWVVWTFDSKDILKTKNVSSQVTGQTSKPTDPIPKKSGSKKEEPIVSGSNEPTK